VRAPEIRIGHDEILVEDGRFRPGHARGIATRYKPGEHSSPATEFKPGSMVGAQHRFYPGQPAFNKLPVGSETVRIETNSGLPRAWVKVAEPNGWKKRAVVVWERDNGPLPRGSVVHHKDRDSLNDAPGNLVALTRKEHVAEHQLEIAEGALAAARKALARAQFTQQAIEVAA
jgi:hypothetical protein